MVKKAKRADGRYSSQVYLGKGEDGKRKYKTVYGKTPKEAKLAADALRERLRKGVNIVHDLDTFEDWGDRWLESRKESVSEAIYNSNKCRLQYFTDVIGEVQLKKINPYDIQKVINDLAQNNPHTGKPSAKQTLGYIRNIAISVFEFAIENRATEYNPAKYTKLPQNAPKDKRRALSETERQRVMDFQHRATTPAMIAMLSGLRRGEITALLWKDVDFKKGMIHVTKSYDFKSNQLKSPKTKAGTRTVPMPKALSDYLRRQPIVSPYVVTSARGHMMTASAWRTLWESYLCDLNVAFGFPKQDVSKHNPHKLPMMIEPFTMHCLRHTYCTMLYEAGIDVLVAKELMGHADVQTTLAIYTHLARERKDRSVDLLNTFLGDASQMQVKNA